MAWGRQDLPVNYFLVPPPILLFTATGPRLDAPQLRAYAASRSHLDPFWGLVLIYNGAARCGRGLLGWLGVGRELRLAQAPLRRLFVPSPPGALMRLAPPLFPLPPPPRPLLSVAHAPARRLSRAPRRPSCAGEAYCPRRPPPSRGQAAPTAPSWASTGCALDPRTCAQHAPRAP